MSFTDVIKKSILQGFGSSDLSTIEMTVTLVITFLIGCYIFIVYRLVSKTSLYDKSFHISMTLISVITAGIILSMQSSIVISLGMVGALSIVRFRTAIKNPMDLLFLFWSIGTGIICGAGLYEIAVMIALLTTVGMFLLEIMPGTRPTYLLIVNGTAALEEDELIKCIQPYSTKYKIKTRNMKKNGSDFIFEITTKKEKELVLALRDKEEIHHLSLLHHEGEVRI